MLRICSTWNGNPVGDAHRIAIEWTPAGDSVELRVSAPHYGDPPAPSSPVGPTDRLWEFEVVEVFVAGSDGRYTEIELAPSGHHLVLQLDGVRNAVASMIPISYTARVAGNRWVGTARIEHRLLPPPPWRVNATAIHGSGADRVYLSMVALPGSAPDFHQPDRFPPLASLT